MSLAALGTDYIGNGLGPNTPGKKTAVCVGFDVLRTCLVRTGYRYYYKAVLTEKHIM